MQSRVLITGANGQLGRDLVSELTGRGVECVASDIQPGFMGSESCEYVPLDITDTQAVSVAIRESVCQRVIHCAAWTAVDAAEDDANRPKVYAINAAGTENIARACSETGAAMTYISTDYVFDGTGTKPWIPDDTSYSPLNYYGETKLLGELAVRKYLRDFFIVRIAWVFGKNGNNFVRTMLKLARTHDTLRVVNDQIGTPTYTPDLARLLADMNATDKFGVYHATNEGGYISWYDFAREIFSQAGVNVNVIPVTTAEYGLSKAKRPYNSRLDKSKLSEAGFEPLPDWRDALRRYLAEYESD
ncbi:MAG: dTDP-4-dehydrorhamnose reductase [Synergistaceae bacterium]|nr:dTDP-4-dehydrorhamnose reductase [Synergistaceae bacterium]MBQ7170120.1 dTDP-4-dehydrorhamnose reductase [Synergistaceae bacterium]MBR0184642.1 dTDP-4-dehydrorhamnose reductase [Synergistaceae bacterium]